MKKIVLIILGFIFGCLCIELVFYFCCYKIKLDEVLPYFANTDEYFIKSQYLEIYDKFFIKEDDYYIKQRSSIIDVGNQKFKVIKDKNIKRIFIVGESVAAYYDINNLYDNLEKYIPSQNFEIVNTGMGSYDSYRIEKILKEIVDYLPDYIIVMIGNNDGYLYNPIMINYLPYKYKIFRKSYILNEISNFLMPRYHYKIENIYPYFKKNIEKMIKDVNGKCSMIFVTLPQNKNSDNEFFEIRRNFIRNLPKFYKNVYVADFDKVLKSFNKNPGYEIFYDNCHYHKPVYDLISKLIIEQIIDKKIKIDKQYFKNLLDCNSKELLSFLDNIKTYKFENFIKYIDFLIKDINSLDEYRNELLICCSELLWRINIDNDYIKTLETTFSETISKYPDKAELYILKAVAYFYLNDDKNFEENMKLAINMNPNIVKKVN